MLNKLSNAYFECYQIEDILWGNVDEIIRQYGGNDTQTSWKLLDSVQTSVRAIFNPSLIMNATVLSDNQL